MAETDRPLLGAARLIAAIPLMMIAVIIGGIVGLFQGIRGWFRPIGFARFASTGLVICEVPERFADLLDLAERFNIGDDVKRAALASTLSESEKRGIQAALAGRAEDLEQWIDGTKVNGHIAEAAIPFANLLQALSEMGLLRDRPGFSKSG
ncbi:MAG: hypothetical protein ACOZBW_07090 [Thermodesulfobacteriota bacterium]